MNGQLNTSLAREPVAIVGVGCRFPGASDLESLWRILRDGIETVGEYPGGRFAALDRFYSVQPGERSSPVTRRGGFLKNLDLFDGDFFGISPREAVLLDPQHRFLLEVGWEALEDGGLPLSRIAGSRTGVFIGQWTSDFEACINESLPEPQFYSTTGSGRYAASARLAYHFDLRGPNLTLDTGCSSSLVAVHLACQSLRMGESEFALAGAVNLILRPEITLAYGSAGMLSPDGRCKFGDASANGYVRSEGAGVVVLKLLRDAIADRDPIHAIILGSAINNDGSSSGLLVSPGREAQAAMFRAALQDAGISAADVDYVEAHGTGTAAGDPVELEAIGSVLAENRGERPCVIGSVKTNLGHSEAAAGMAGLCKLIISLRHAAIPATLNFRNPNPNIAWSELPLTINTELQPWPHDGQTRIAGLDSFGITGTNAHAILQSAPVSEDPSPNDDRPHLFLLSARSAAALDQTAASWRARMQEDSSWPVSVADLAYTAAVRRTHHPHRLAVVAKDASDLDAQLAAWLEHEPGELTRSGRASATPSRVAFVFSGQGGQWPGMGRELFEREPVFRRALTSCDRALLPCTGWSVIDEITQTPSAACHDIDRIQPTLFALMIALTELWRSWGVEPGAVVGHSMGEVAAAVVCGALSVEDGAAVIAHRSRLMKTVSGRGLMAMAALTFAEASDFIQPYHGRIAIAANNGPSSTILAGDVEAVEEAIATLESREIYSRRVEVDVASHCAQMDPVAPELEQAVASIVPRRAHLPLYSTSTGRIEDGLSLGASYWSRNLREPVMFADAVQGLLRDGFQTFIEVNAHPVLLHSIQEGATRASREVLEISSMRRDKDQLAEMLGSLGALHVSGQPINYRGLYAEGRCLRLPAYPWQRERYWPEENKAGGNRFNRRGPHPDLGAPISLSHQPGSYLFAVDPCASADGIMAAAWWMELVVAAACDLLKASFLLLEDIRFLAAIAPSNEGQLVLSPQPDGTWSFRLSEKSGDTWASCCEGTVRSNDGAAAQPVEGHSVGRSIPSTPQPLTACLQSVAASLGYIAGDAGWKITHIERVWASRSPAGEHIQIRTSAGAGSTAAAETDDRKGNAVVRVHGVQFTPPPKSDCSKHIYEWKWTENEPPMVQGRPSGTILVCGDPETSVELARRLRSRATECVVAPNLNSCHELIESLGSALQAVVWIGSAPEAEPARAVRDVEEVSSLVRTITGTQSPPRDLWLVTRGAHPFENQPGDLMDALPSNPAQAALWGLGRVIACEHPELHCFSIDLDIRSNFNDFELFVRLLATATHEEQIAIRGEKLYGLRLERRVQSGIPELMIRRDATYLITGGLGALGLALASLLAERGAKYLCLVGRRPPGEIALETIGHLQRQGVQVRCVAADVAEEIELAAVLNDLDKRTAPLKGVFHLAGITEDALLSDLNRDSIERVLRPKAKGAWNLHCLTSNLDLDIFVLYSSLAAVSSQPGQAAYAAANAYLDGLAALRRACGQPALSIQWGPWKEAGMIREAGAHRSRLAWAEQGIEALDIETALDGLERLLAHPVPVAFIARVDWNKFARAFRNVSPAFSRLAEPAASPAAAVSTMRDQLAALPASERAKSLESYLKSIVAAVTKRKVNRIDSESRFGSMGVDSLMAVEVARRVTETLGLRLPATALYNFPTLQLLTSEVARRMELESRPSATPESAVSDAGTPLTQSTAPAIAEMSEEEALQSLLKGANTP